jgi:hypothetical protein
MAGRVAQCEGPEFKPQSTAGKIRSRSDILKGVSTEGQMFKPFFLL